MGYVPKFIHLDHFIVVEYPFGVHWKHSYIQQSAEAIFNTYKEDIEEGTSITFVARGTSGAMIAGAMLKKSDVKYEVIQFPDGEPHIVLNGIDRKDDLTVVCRVCNPTDLFILMQVGDILNRLGTRRHFLIM